jgi:hypothetical protein
MRINGKLEILRFWIVDEKGEVVMQCSNRRIASLHVDKVNKRDGRSLLVVDREQLG